MSDSKNDLIKKIAKPIELLLKIKFACQQEILEADIASETENSSIQDFLDGRVDLSKSIIEEIEREGF